MQPRPFKNPNFPSLSCSIHSPRPTFENPNFESIDKLGKFMTFVKIYCCVENKMRNSYKNRMSTF